MEMDTEVPSPKNKVNLQINQKKKMHENRSVIKNTDYNEMHNESHFGMKYQ